AEHDEEADDGERRRRRERQDEEHEPGDEAEGGPLQVAAGVPVERGRADLADQVGGGGVKLLLDLLEDALFVLGQRHAASVPTNLGESQPRTGAPPRAAERYTASATRWAATATSRPGSGRRPSATAVRNASACGA